MEVSRESLRVRWIGLLAAWIVAGVLIFAHAKAFKDNLDLANGLALRGAAVSPTPMHRICPTMYADALMWVRHSLRIADGDGLRIRYTYADNAPIGREIHWNSGFAWLVLGEGWLRHVITGEPLPTAVEQWMAWFNVPLLLAFIALVSTWVTRRAGLAAGAFIALAMVGNDDFYGGFGPNYVDHHGILAVAVLGLVMGAVFMGAGFWRSSGATSQLLPSSVDTARRAAIASAIFGGAGMWVSAATLIPAIAIVGISGLVATVLHGRSALKSGVHAAPEIWRLWGRTGGLVCFGFYLLEYAPNHLGFRLEVNHPAYAVGWWAGSEVIAQFAEWWFAARGQFRPNWKRLGLAALGLAVAPTIIAIGGEKVFVVFDPFITRLSRHVAEGISLITACKLFGTSRFDGQFAWTGVAMLAGLVAWIRTRTPDRILLAFGFVAVTAFTAMAVSQLRWGPSAAGPQMVLIVLTIACLVGPRAARWRWVAIGAAIAVLCLPLAVIRYQRVASATANRAVDKTDTMQPIYRDIAAALRASQPDGRIVLLASPNASVAIGYYGLFQTIGTLYWENLDGTKAAAQMFSAQTEQEARRLIRKRGVTHVAFISEDNFIAEYFDLLHPNATDVSLPRSFGYRGLVDQSFPMWLEQIPYELTSDLPYKPNRVMLFKTRFTPKPDADALYEAALKLSDTGDMAGAEKKLDQALAVYDGSAEFWIAKTNLQIARGDLPGAAASVTKAVTLAQGADRFTISTAEAARFYQQRAYRAAAQLYQVALSVKPDPIAANNLAWILATAADDGARNGSEALSICTQLAKEHQDIVYLNAYAAALAEVGRFEEATKVAERALELLRKGGDQKAAATAETRVNAYRSSRPWRE
jgi:tetratricopeptide (TPR) repeat protein